MGVPSLLLTGEIALVTGARRGIGKAIALRFAQAGADVALCDVIAYTGELDAVAQEIKKLGQRSLAMQVDVRDKAAINKMVQKVEDELGDISILVNVAGVLSVCPLVELSEEDWDKVLDTNLRGCYLCCQAALKGMIKRKKGNIINIASTDAFNPIPYQSVYNSSKSGLCMLTNVLAFEVGRYGIRVNAIAPGWIETQWTEDYDRAGAIAEIGLGRIGEPSEVANVALFLASDLASYVSGTTWRVDGALNPGPLSMWPEKLD